MDPTRQKPLPDPNAFTPGEKPRREEAIVRDEKGNERKPPSIKEEYKAAHERRRNNENN